MGSVQFGFLKGGKSNWVRKGVREAGHKLGEAWKQIGCVEEVKYLTSNKLNLTKAVDARRDDKRRAG